MRRETTALCCISMAAALCLQLLSGGRFEKTVRMAAGLEVLRLLLRMIGKLISGAHP